MIFPLLRDTQESASIVFPSNISQQVYCLEMIIQQTFFSIMPNFDRPAFSKEIAPFTLKSLPSLPCKSVGMLTLLMQYIDNYTLIESRR
jgi:hypothetical protein